MADFIKVALVSEIPEDTGKHVEAGGRELAVFKSDEGYKTIDAVCPHAGGPLAEGGFDGSAVMCPWHGWQFNVKTGKCTFNETIAVPVYETKEKGGSIFVKV